MRLPRMMAAPSCSGPPGVKMLTSSSADHDGIDRFAASAYMRRLCARSMAMSAPMRFAERTVARVERSRRTAPAPRRWPRATAADSTPSAPARAGSRPGTGRSPRTADRRGSAARSPRAPAGRTRGRRRTSSPRTTRPIEICIARVPRISAEDVVDDEGDDEDVDGIAPRELQREDAVVPVHRAALRCGCRSSASRSPSSTCRKSTVSRTSWTRTIDAPPRCAAATAASEPSHALGPGGAPGDVADERLARRADHDRRDRRQLVAAREQLEVVLERLGEADAGIDEDLLAIDAGGDAHRRRIDVSSRATSLHDVVVVA